ncbi:MAG: type II/IV secretion system protein [Parcubacteria group bacterium]|nr:type II/IV secretion system protein [Parcubacteria group bacterium]
MKVNEKQLEEFLLDADLVSTKRLGEAWDVSLKSGGYLGDALVKRGDITEDELRKTEAYILGIPFVNLKGEKLNFDVLSLIPEPIARNNNIIAFKKTSDSLEVAMLDTDDLAALDFVKKKVNLKILPRLTDTESIKSALLQYQKSLKAEFGDIIEKEAGTIKEVRIGGEDDTKSEEELRKLAEDLPVIRIVDTLLHHAILQGASDIHIEPMEDKVLVRYRIDGILHDAMTLPRHAASGIIARVKVLANLKLDEKRLPQDGRFKIAEGNQRVSFRVSILPTYFGEKGVLRLLKEDTEAFTLETLGFHGDGLEQIHRATKQRTGMVLATGPTGSGKTTTLYTILSILNSPDVNISTIEDPIEYQIPRVNQTQVKPEIGYTFANGLRALVRQDPDIIMVGEIRDSETASLAINASLTGHLVLSTLHTNSASGAIPRLIDMEAEPFLLVSTVRIIIGQRLVRRLCEEKQKYTIREDDLLKLAEHADMDKVLAMLREEKIVGPKESWKSIPFYKPKPSKVCADGYGGRVGIHEVLHVTSTIEKLILQEASSTDIEAQARKEGMITMLEDGIFKAAQGITSLEEVFRVISE